MSQQASWQTLPQVQRPRKKARGTTTELTEPYKIISLLNKIMHFDQKALIYLVT